MFKLLKNGKPFSLTDKDVESLKKDLRLTVGAETLKMAYLDSDKTTALDRNTGQQQVKTPGGRSVYLTGKIGNITYKLYDTEMPDPINPNIVRYVPNTLPIQHGQIISDPETMFFLLYCSEYVQGNKIKESDRKAPIVKIANDRMDAIEQIQRNKRKRQLLSMIEVDSDNDIEDQLMLLNIAKALNIANVDTNYPVTKGSGKNAKPKIGGSIEELSIQVMGIVGTVTPQKANKYLRLFSKSNVDLLYFIHLTKLTDNKTIVLERTSTEGIVWGLDSDGLKTEKILGNIPITEPDHRKYVVDKMKEDEALRVKLGIKD